MTPPDMKSQVTLYTDGACRGNPGPGGWGAYLIYADARKSLKGAATDTTNNRMELSAVIEGLRALKRPCKVNLKTDSKYVLQGITEWMPGWKRKGWRTAANKPVKNAELWRELDAETSRHDIEWHWVKGHSGVEGNEIADRLANEAIDQMLQEQT